MEEILKALILPLGEAAHGPEGPDLAFLQLVGRAFSEPAEFLRRGHDTFLKMKIWSALFIFIQF